MKQAAITIHFAHQVRRTLDAARQQGYVFPDRCIVGVSLLVQTAYAASVRAHIDDHAVKATIRGIRQTADLAATVDLLTARWRVTHARRGAPRVARE